MTEGYVVVFRSTRNALLRQGRRNWQTRADMLARVEADGIVAPSLSEALAQCADFIPGSSGVVAVDYAEWRREMGA